MGKAANKSTRSNGNANKFNRNPEDLVAKFKQLLRKEGVEIEGTSGAKYFAAGIHGRIVVVLAHESREVGFWGSVASY